MVWCLLLNLPFAFPKRLNLGGNLVRICLASSSTNSQVAKASRAIESKARLCAMRRDHYNCRVCGMTGDEITLEIHLLVTGIGYPNTLITLCARCSRQVPFKEGCSPSLHQSSLAASRGLWHSSPLTEA